MKSPSPLIDTFGRHIDYLRISLTERCDLHCAYCRPRDVSAQPDELTADDVAAIATAAVRCGVTRIRLTGGEPLLRDDLTEIVSRLRRLPGLEDLALTTNGQLLAGRASQLADAGLMRVNISLDSLDPEVYAATTGGGDVGAVLRAIDAALDAGLSPVKVNVVLHSPAALEQGALPSFAELVERPIHVRFIEAMPTCAHIAYVPAGRVMEALGEMGELTPAVGPPGGGPARYCRLADAVGTFGIITPVSEPFCSQCNRLRVSARGELMPCLFSAVGISLIPALRSDHPIDRVVELLGQAAAAKPRRYGDVAEPSGIQAMHIIGG